MIRLPSYFLGFSSKSDGSASLRFGTQELSAEDFAELKRNQNQFGWLVFNETVTEADIPTETPEEEGKSTSERLRAVLFVYWKQKNLGGDFEAWRKGQMEKYIDGVKSMLD